MKYHDDKDYDDFEECDIEIEEKEKNTKIDFNQMYNNIYTNLTKIIEEFKQRDPVFYHVNFSIFDINALTKPSLSDYVNLNIPIVEEFVNLVSEYVESEFKYIVNKGIETYGSLEEFQESEEYLDAYSIAATFEYAADDKILRNNVYKNISIYYVMAY